MFLTRKRGAVVLGDLIKPGSPFVTDGTFARASSATVFDYNGVLQTVASNIPRMHGARLDGTDWYLDDGSGNPVHPIVFQDGVQRLAQHGDWPGASQAVAVGDYINPKTLSFGNDNLFSDAEDRTGGSWLGSAVVTANAAVAADGTMTADEVEDNTGGLIDSSQITTGVSTSGTYYCYHELEAGTSNYPEIDMVFQTGGTTLETAIVLDLTDGSHLVRKGTPLNVSIVNITGNIWAVSFGATNNGTGNTALQVYFRPAWNTSLTTTLSVAATGSVYIGATKVEESSQTRYRHSSEKGYIGAGNGYYYECTTAGTTGSLEPVWPVGTVGSDTITDGDVVWTLKGLYRNPGYVHEATAVLNSCSDSSDFDPATTGWTGYGAGPTYLTDTGIDGVSRDNIRVSDNSAGGQGGSYFTTAIADDTATHGASLYLKKEDDETIFPMVGIAMAGGSYHPAQWHVNKRTGATAVRSGPNGGTIEVLDAGDWWYIRMEHANNGSGNTTLETWLGGADGSVFGTTSGATTGASTFDKVLIHVNGTAHGMPIDTDGGTATRAAETLNYPLANYSDTAGAIFADVTPLFASTDTAADHSILSFSTSAQTGFQLDGSDQVEIEDGTNSAVTAAQTWSTGDTLRCGARWQGATIQAAVDGSAGTAGTYDGAFASDTSLEVGQGNTLPMIVHNLSIFGRATPEDVLERLTSKD